MNTNLPPPQYFAYHNSLSLPPPEILDIKTYEHHPSMKQSKLRFMKLIEDQNIHILCQSEGICTHVLFTKIQTNHRSFTILSKR